MCVCVLFINPDSCPLHIYNPMHIPLPPPPLHVTTSTHTSTHERTLPPAAQPPQQPRHDDGDAGAMSLISRPAAAAYAADRLIDGCLCVLAPPLLLACCLVRRVCVCCLGRNRIRVVGLSPQRRTCMRFNGCIDESIRRKGIYRGSSRRLS